MTKHEVLNYVLHTLNLKEIGKRFSAGMNFEVLDTSCEGHIRVEIGENNKSFSVAVCRTTSTGVPHSRLEFKIKKDDWWLNRFIA